MTREEIMKKLDRIKEQKFYIEMDDFGYHNNYQYLIELNREEADLEKRLEELEK